MPANLAQPIAFGANDTPFLKRVHFTGTDALRQGHIVCFDRDNATATGLIGGTSTTLTAAYASHARYQFVEKPSTSNLQYGWGIVTQDYTANSAGQDITIEIPGAHGTAIDVFSSANATIVSTPLFVQPGSYVAGSSGGRYIGRAIQTVDRSTTNGLIKTVCFPSNSFPVEYGADATTSIPSQTIWSNMPTVGDIQRDPSLGIWVDTRIGNHGFTSNADSAAVISRTTDSHGYTLFVTADNDECNIVWNQGGFRLGSGAPKMAFECAIKASAVTQAHGAFVGLASGIAATNFLNDTGAVPVNTRAYYGFRVAESAPATIDLIALESGGTAVTLDAAAGTLSSTIQKFGFYYNGTDILTYLNGTLIGDNTLAAEIASTTFPTNIYMSPAVGVKGGHTTDYTFTLSWLRCIQAGF